MPAILPNTPTANDYPATNNPAGTQVGLNDVFASGYFVVANAAAYAQYQHGQQGQQDFSADIFLPPATYPLVGTKSDPLGGLRFKSAVAGVPAQVFGVLYKEGEASLLAGSEFSSNVSGGGSVVPGVQNVQVQKNGALIGAESILNFIDSQQTWTITDVPASTRIDITPKTPRDYTETFKSGAQSIATGVPTVLTWAGASPNDNARWAVGAPGRVFFPAGLYMVGGSVFSDPNGSGGRKVEIVLNSATVLAGDDSPSGGQASSTAEANVSVPHLFLANEWVELWVLQTSGVALNYNIGCKLWAYKLPSQ